MKLPEQICPDEQPRYRKWLKKVAAKVRRRRGKIDPEDSLTKLRFRGYST